MVTYRTSITIIVLPLKLNRKSDIRYRLAYLYLHLTFAQSKIKAMPISIANMLEMVKDMTNIAIAMKQDVRYWLSIVIFIFYHVQLERLGSRLGRVGSGTFRLLYLANGNI